VPDPVDVLIAGDAPIPAYAHPGDAGADLVSAESLRLEPGQRATVGTGVSIAIRVTLLNTDAEAAYDVAVGDRIAQVVVMPVSRVRFVPVEKLPGSHRGSGGFGSTGTGALPARDPGDRT
jgi:dUTP pyrophosphatase